MTATTYITGLPALQRYVGCGKRTAQTLMRDGLPVRKINSRTLVFRLDEVDTFLDKYKERVDEPLISRLMGV
jgi:hypothetical protein